ncbi:MAG: hypothetical protein IKT97_04595, partial [Spirochaetia bacterium]|nr:hypothetical protein [Spirochaetia bacterium]
MKKIFIFMALLLCLFLIACGGGGGGSDAPSGGGNGGNGGNGGSGEAVIPPSDDYLCFTANEDGCSISTTVVNGPLTVTPSLEYSTDKEIWTPFIIDSTTVPLPNTDDKVYIRATDSNASFSESVSKYIKFTMEGSIAASGNIMSLLDKDCTSTTIPCNSCFSHLFFGCSALTTAPDLPAMTLASHCYSFMFYNCSSLTEPPVLSATTLADSCYSDMFFQCYSLQTTPVLPAITLADSCYEGMFYKCTNLTMAHDLPATTLAYACCWDMFRNCT